MRLPSEREGLICIAGERLRAAGEGLRGIAGEGLRATGQRISDRVAGLRACIGCGISEGKAGCVDQAGRAADYNAKTGREARRSDKRASGSLTLRRGC